MMRLRANANFTKDGTPFTVGETYDVPDWLADTLIEEILVGYITVMPEPEPEPEPEPDDTGQLAAPAPLDEPAEAPVERPGGRA